MALYIPSHCVVHACHNPPTPLSHLLSLSPPLSLSRSFPSSIATSQRVRVAVVLHLPPVGQSSLHWTLGEN